MFRPFTCMLACFTSNQFVGMFYFYGSNGFEGVFLLAGGPRVRSAPPLEISNLLNIKFT